MSNVDYTKEKIINKALSRLVVILKLIPIYTINYITNRQI